MTSKQQFAAIAALDLDPIKVKLMHEASGEGWSLAYADAVEFEYRRFLYLMKKFPHEQTAPLFDVDVFWHYHILDTMKYAADCEAVFGYFLHHFPYVGLRGDQDIEAHRRAGERMRELYEQTYPDRYILQAEPAYWAVGGAPAFSAAAVKTAFSVAVAHQASPVERFAFSVAAATLPSQDDALGTRICHAPARADAAPFYSVRPTLSRALQLQR